MNTASSTVILKKLSSISQFGELKKVLFCVLNWGLGHATRSLPIIHYAIQQGHEVRIASNGEALSYLRSELPGITCYELPDSGIHYKYKSMYWNMAIASPQLIRSYKQEKIVTQRITKEFVPDLIISDNRYGCYHQKVYSIMISHQAQIMSVNPLVRRMSKRMLHLLTKPFHEIWIPDLQDSASITGEMSNFPTRRSRYIGLLSTCYGVDIEPDEDQQILILLSGPEPQRSQLEKQLLSNLPFPNERFKLIRGTEQRPEIPIPSSLQHINITGREQVHRELLKSSMLICRSGYSTIMDLVSAGKPAVYIPTPGQFEQIYLAKKMQHLNAGYVLHQKDIDIGSLRKALTILGRLNMTPKLAKSVYKLELDRVLSD